MSDKLLSDPTEEMCDAARWFILARDANIYTWGGLTRCYDKTIPFIEEKAKADPQGHITKSEFAECVWLLMEAARNKHSDNRIPVEGYQETLPDGSTRCVVTKYREPTKP